MQFNETIEEKEIITTMTCRGTHIVRRPRKHLTAILDSLVGDKKINALIFAEFPKDVTQKQIETIENLDEELVWVRLREEVKRNYSIYHIIELKHRGEVII